VIQVERGLAQACLLGTALDSNRLFACVVGLVDVLISLLCRPCGITRTVPHPAVWPLRRRSAAVARATMLAPVEDETENAKPTVEQERMQ